MPLVGSNEAAASVSIAVAANTAAGALEMRATEVEMFQRLRSPANSWLTSKGLLLYVFADSTLKLMAQQRPQTLI